MSKASRAAGNLLSDIVARGMEQLARKAIEGGVARIGRFAGNLHDRSRDAMYDTVTDPVRSSRIKVGDPEGEATDFPEFATKAGYRKSNLRPLVDVGQPPEGGWQPGDPRAVPWNSPRFDPSERRWVGRATKTPTDDWQGVFYDNPEATASAAGVASVGAAGLGAVGAGLAAGSWIFGEQGKPRSAYRVPVQPSKQQGGYNPSVESALASASAKYELQEQKHAHAMELQRLRMEAKTPGSQYSDPSMPDVNSGAPPMTDIYRSPSLFGDGKKDQYGMYM